MKKILAFALCLVMVLSLASVAFAEEAQPTTYSKVTSGELTSGKYVLIASNGYAPAQLDGSWILTAQPTVEGDKVTDAQGAVWELTVDGSNVKLKDANGKEVAPKGGNSNGIKEGEYAWAYSYVDGAFRFAGQGDDTVYLASNVSSDGKFRGYKTATVEGNPEGYPYLFVLYKLDEAAGEQPGEGGNGGGDVNPGEGEDLPPAGDMITLTAIALAVSGMGLAALSFKKKSF